MLPNQRTKVMCRFSGGNLQPQLMNMYITFAILFVLLQTYHGIDMVYEQEFTGDKIKIFI